MNIVVCVKQVPDTSEVKIDPVTNNLVREGIPSIMNPADENALEEALKLKAVRGAEVTAVSMGPPQAETVLQKALDMGADRAILLSDPAIAGSDSLATGYILSEIIKTIQADLILCGNEAADGCTGQVGPMIAENIGIPHITYVNEILALKSKTLEASREGKEDYELLHCDIPVVVCVLKGINIPRKPLHSTLKPEKRNATDFKLDKKRIGISGSPTRVAKIDIPKKGINSFVIIDSSLPADEKIFAIMYGGFIPKKLNLIRGTSLSLANLIFNDEGFSSRTGN
jgi:electron transfer flavoprotein beta subunit